ncbi:unnamed protein product [Discula destructiva]
MPQEEEEAPSEYTHTPLAGASSLRLVRIHPDLQDNRLSCTLEHFDSASNTCPEYVALSYVWGDPAPRHPIYINHLPRLIHTNLWLFLRRAWHNGAASWFWIDSLSLDQTSHPELNVQVARMCDIYARACHVISWLGESQRGADALEAMTQLLARRNSSPFGVNVLDMRTPAGQRLDRAWTQLVRLEGSEYWERVWVLQEVACAKASSVVYGPVAVDFEELVQCEELESLYQFWATGTQDGPFYIAAEWIGKLYALRKLVKTGGRIDLVDLMEDLAGASSTRLVDRVYGLIGLCSRLDPDFDPAHLEIDYDKDLEAVAWDVVLLTLDNTPPSLWKGFHRTMTRIFRALGIVDRVSPPRHHHSFANTSQSRRARTRRICQVHDAVVASGYPWAAGLGVWSTNWSFDSVVSATAALEQVLNHVCASNICPRRKMSSEDGLDAILALSLVISNMETLGGHKEAGDVSSEDHTAETVCSEKTTTTTTTTTETLPRLCEVHLPQHLRRSVHFRRGAHRGSSKTTARVHHLQPVTTACRDGAHWWDDLPRCDAGSPDNPCDDARVYLEIPELALVMCSQRDMERDTSDESGVREHVQWFCTACPLLWGAVDESDQSPENMRPPSPLNAHSMNLSETTSTTTTMMSSSAMPTISEKGPLMVLPVKFESISEIEDSDSRFLRSADFPWGRRPSLMDAWKEHRAKDMSRSSM